MTNQSFFEQVRLIMEAVAVLHSRGYGRLKIYCYIKEELGAWRHGLFAAEFFPRREDPRPACFVDSVPGQLARGDTADEVADAIIVENPELLQSALGADVAYMSWYKGMLTQYPKGILDMESSEDARIRIAGVAPIPHPLGSVDGQ